MTQSQAPPSCVLMIKMYDLPEDELRQQCAAYGGQDELPTFIQNSKQLAFVQFPSTEHASQALDFFNEGCVVTQSSKTVSAMYSNRKEVTVEGKRDSMRDDQQFSGKRMRDDNNSQYLPKRPNLSSGRAPALNLSGCRTNSVLDILNNNAQNRAVQQDQPSPVLCIKADLSEDDMVGFLEELGRRERFAAPLDVLTLSQKNMSFVQYSDSRQSQRVLQHLNHGGYECPSGLVISANFSKRTCIQRDQKPRTTDGDDGKPVPRLEEAPPSKVIIATLRSTRPNIPPPHFTVETLIAPFSRCGIVTKMILFKKKDSQTDYQVLVQYDNLQYAQLAREIFVGRYLINNQELSNYRILARYSDRQELSIEQNGAGMRDFANPWLPEAGSNQQRDQQRDQHDQQ